jgi:alkylhydroperoxidase/carboxymuconolactone decarboxylase family protein YurZ
MSDGERGARGETARRRILGDAHVDAARRATTPFTREFDDLITRYAWGEIWTRDGLDARTRRVLVLGTLLAGGRWEAFALPGRAALADDVGEDVIKEVVLQQAVYCGVPAAHHALRVAAEVIEAAGPAVNGPEGERRGT